jgi:hypothetical protein
MPDLPSSQEIARIARSPVQYLNSMAAADDRLVPDPAAHNGDAKAASGAWPVDPSAPHDASSSNGHGATESTFVRPVGIPDHQVPADPGMN